jgi:hypothetical protein
LTAAYGSGFGLLYIDYFFLLLPGLFILLTHSFFTKTIAPEGESNTEHDENLPDGGDEGCPTELMALVVTDEFPAEVGQTTVSSTHLPLPYWHYQTLDKILEANDEEAESLYLWLADSYDSIPDSRTPHYTDGTSYPVSENLRSPLIGHSLRRVAKFIRDVPSPPNPLDKLLYCAVLRREEYERNEILIVKIPEAGDDSELKTWVTDWDRVGMFVIGSNRYRWEDLSERRFV